MLKFFRFPFATTGDKTAVPDVVDSNGNVSYSQGYGFDYQRQKTDPAAKNIERDKMNQILFDITTAIAEIQSKGGADFITSALNGGTAYSYSQNAIVNYGGAWYISLVAANTALPTDATKWALLPTPALLQQAAFMSANAGGTVDAITAAFSPAIATLPAAPGTLSVFVRATGANTSTTPTFKADATAAKPIVKGANQALVAGDIAGASHWLELQYDATLDKWVLQNPATGVTNLGLRANTVNTIAANTVLTAANLGASHVIYSGSALTITLPALSASPIGTRLEFLNCNSGVATITRAGADTIFGGNANVNSIALGFGDTLTLVSRGDYWFAVGGSSQLAFAPAGLDLVPAGAVALFAMSTPPAGWVKANGAILNRTTYARLFAAIGTTFGAGDGSTTFQLPDARGQFLRGFDDGRGVDSGRVFGSTQAANTPRDAQYRVNNISTGVSLANGAYVSGFVITDATLLAVNSVENRPTNLALMPCIKY